MIIFNKNQQKKKMPYLYNFLIILISGYIVFCSSYPLEDPNEKMYLLATENQPVEVFYLPELINDFIDQDSVDTRPRPTRSLSSSIRRNKKTEDPFVYGNNFEKRSGSGCVKHKIRIHRIFIG